MGHAPAGLRRMAVDGGVDLPHPGHRGQRSQPAPQFPVDQSHHHPHSLQVGEQSPGGGQHRYNPRLVVGRPDTVDPVTGPGCPVGVGVPVAPGIGTLGVDLVAVEENPISDVAAMRGISFVMQSGRVVRDDRPAA
ncbi:MAG: hypothetical protein OXF41_17025 [bacterium]|nr:hypothetical protein [bacterium]